VPPVFSGGGLAVAWNGARTEASLSWTPAVDPDLVGYLVVSKEGAAPADCEGDTDAGAASATDTGFKVTGLNGTKQYGFRVCAVDLAGNVSAGRSAAPTP
jgi:hypothetical protein